MYLSFRKYSTVFRELFLGKTIQFNSGGVGAAERVTRVGGDEEGNVLASIRNLQGL